LTYGLAYVIDRLIIGVMLGSKQAGYYGLNILMNATMLILPSLLAQITYPKMAYEYGRQSKIEMYRLYHQQWKWGIYLTIPMMVIVAGGGTLLVLLFLPEYRPGLAAIANSISMPWGNLLLVKRKLGTCLRAGAISLGLSAMLSVAAIKLQNGIADVAVASLVSYSANVWLYYLSTKTLLFSLRKVFYLTQKSA
jgi:O-antigen/teichoic acid export membrane protein